MGNGSTSSTDLAGTLAGAVAIAVVVGAGCWGLDKVIVASAEAYRIITTPGAIPPIATWVAPTAAIGAAATGATTTILVLVKASHGAAEQPAEWTAPILAILGGFGLDLAKAYGTGNEFLRALFALLIALLVVVGGNCWKARDWKLKVLGVLLLVAPPVALLAQNLQPEKKQDLLQNISQVGLDVWLRLALFAVIAVAILGLYELYGKKRKT